MGRRSCEPKWRPSDQIIRTSKCEIENEYDLRISNQLRFQSARSSLLLRSREGGYGNDVGGTDHNLKPATRNWEVVLALNQGHPTVPPNSSIRGISVRKAKNCQRYSDLIAVKATDFFGETSPRTLVTRGLICSYCFWRDKYVV